MSDIKRFLLRLPVSMWESMEAEAIRLNTSVNQLILDRLSDNQGQIPQRLKAAERTRAIAAKLPSTYCGADLPEPANPKVSDVRIDDGHDSKRCRIYGCLLCAEEKSR